MVDTRVVSGVITPSVDDAVRERHTGKRQNTSESFWRLWLTLLAHMAALEA